MKKKGYSKGQGGGGVGSKGRMKQVDVVGSIDPYASMKQAPKVMNKPMGSMGQDPKAFQYPH